MRCLPCVSATNSRSPPSCNSSSLARATPQGVHWTACMTSRVRYPPPLGCDAALEFHPPGPGDCRRTSRCFAARPGAGAGIFGACLPGNGLDRLQHPQVLWCLRISEDESAIVLDIHHSLRLPYDILAVNLLMMTGFVCFSKFSSTDFGEDTTSSSLG